MSNQSRRQFNDSITTYPTEGLSNFVAPSNFSQLSVTTSQQAIDEQIDRESLTTMRDLVETKISTQLEKEGLIEEK